MPVPFGFSVGDCISVCLLIKDTIKALDSVHGAKAEYKAVIRELWALDRALLDVVSLQETMAHGNSSTKELNALFVTVGRAVQECKGSIKNFLRTIKGYEGSLDGGDGNGSLWSGVRGKISWALLRKDDLNKFRAEVNAHSSAINMLLITASVSLTEIHGRNLIEGSDQQLSILGQVKDTLDEQGRTLELQGSTVSRLADSMRYFFTLGAELKALMTRIWTLNFRSYNILLQLQTRVPPEFKSCWIQEPLILTDALGRIAPVHLELINSWDVLESVLEARFRNIPGERKIIRREYALQDRSSQLDIERSASFESCFLPGRKIDMSMVFKQGPSTGASCPGCGMEARRGNVVAATCAGCGIWFQRVEELIEEESETIIEPPPAIAKSIQTPLSQCPTQHPVSTPPKTEVLPRKRKIDAVDGEEHMTLFKRVRLLQRKYINSRRTKAKSGQTQRLSTLSCLTKRRHRLFAWLDNNGTWESAQDEKRQRALPADLLETESFLQLAALKGDKEAVQALLSQGEDINAVNAVLNDPRYLRSRCTALHVAVEGGHTGLVEYLLSMGADPNINLDFWGTPLVIAARKHNTEIAEILLRHGADVDQESIYQKSVYWRINALHRASYDGDLAMANLLLAYGAKANGRSGHFGPALVAATMNDNVELVEQLIHFGADMNVMHFYGQNPCSDYRRRQNPLARAISHNCIRTINKLLELGADINLECECGNALQNAAYFGHEEILDDLISRGADIFQPTQSFVNALEASVAGGQERMFKKLLGLGLDIHVKCTNLDNLLQVAARSGEDSILTYLLDQGMNVNRQGGHYVNALIAAASCGHTSTCRILIDNGADLHVHRGDQGCALHTAVEHSHVDTVRLLLDAGASINTIGGKYGTVLQLAALNTSEDVVHLLLDRGADVNIHAGYFGNALQAWSYVGNQDIVQLILDKGADPNARGGFYETALISAVHGRHESIIELLLNSGAEVGIISTSFGSALDHATRLVRESTHFEEEDMHERIIQLLTNFEHDLGWSP